MAFAIDVLIQGLLYGILTMGVMLSYKILDIPDLSVDGTFPLGAVVSAVLIIQGVNPWIALIASLLAGVLAGMMTGIFHVKFKITALLSGILVMTGLYSINLLIGGKGNIALFKYANLFDTNWLEAINAPSFIVNNYQLIVMVLLMVGVKIFIDFILRTRLGYLLKVTGDNENLVASLGHDVGKVKIFGLALSNGIVALSGGVAVSVGKSFDISMGTGMVVLGLASVILGTLLLRKTKCSMTFMVIVGSILYRFIIAIAIRMNMDPKMMKLATVIIFVGAIVLNNLSTKLPRRKMKEQ